MSRAKKNIDKKTTNEKPVKVKGSFLENKSADQKKDDKAAGDKSRKSLEDRIDEINKEKGKKKW